MLEGNRRLNGTIAMAVSIEAYRDNRGHVHDTPADAVIADIAAALGRVGEEGGLTNGVAKLILDKRADIERAFADLDRLVSQQADIIETVDEPNIRQFAAAMEG